MVKRNLLGVVLLLCGFCTFAQTSPIVDFIKKNPNESALYIIKNDTAVVKHNEHVLMPLASTVKLVVAIEFAKQSGAGVFDTAKYVAISELDKFYLPLTDGGAHPAWKKYTSELGLIKNDSVRLIDIARGMIMFSSNANTDFLIGLLGIQNVNSNLKLLNLKDHTPIYPIVSPLFFYQNPKGKKEEVILKSILKMSDSEYAHYAYKMHLAMKADNKLKASFRPMDVTAAMQKMWSDRLPASTVRTYAQLANTLNKRAFLSKDAYGVLQRVVEFLMENPNNISFLQHAGMKGGSTSFVLTKCFYATLTDGTRIEIAIFFNNITYREVNKLSAQLNDFELRILTEPNFINEIQEEMKVQ